MKFTRRVVWILDEILDHIPAISFKEKKFYLFGGWGCRLNLVKYWGKDIPRRSRIYELGEFEGDTFVFNEPYTLPNGSEIKRMLLSEIQMNDVPLTKEQVIEAMTDPNAIVAPWGASEDGHPLMSLDGNIDDPHG